jgi:hypothetical protein
MLFIFKVLHRNSNYLISPSVRWIHTFQIIVRCTLMHSEQGGCIDVPSVNDSLLLSRLKG